MSILNVDTIQPVSTGTTVTVSNGDFIVGTGVTIGRSGIITATTFKGGAEITSGTAAFSGNVSVGGVLTYEDVTNVDSVGVVTAREGIRVGAGKSIGSDSGTVSYFGDVSNCTGAGVGSNDSVNTTGIVTATTFIQSVGQLSNRNLIVNGACIVAQRGLSSTSGNIQTVDRWRCDTGGGDENPTQAQHSLTSSDTGPWELGFRKSYHITNGNQTSGAGAADYMQVTYKPEGQDINRSGWKFTDPNSKVTLSYWIKASVAQTFYGFIEASGPTRIFGWETGALTANTWKKVTVIIPGYATLAIPDTNALAFSIAFIPFYGTNYTHVSNRPVGTWYEAYNYLPNNTSTWWTTNDATFEITGVQLEVGSVATPFEHRSYGDELLRCQRYFEVYYMNAGTGGLTGLQSNGSNHENSYQFKVQKRAQPSGALMGNASWYTATPNLFTSPTECGFHNGSSWFQLSDGSQDASLGFNAEL